MRQGDERRATGSAASARRGGALCAALALGALALLSSPPPAGADIEFCPPGEGAGQCAPRQRAAAQRALAADTESGRLYVADEANNRVNVFELDGDFLFAFGWGVDTGAATLETCTLASGCQKGIAGSGPGQLDRPTDVTADNDPASPSHHAVYVTDSMTNPENLRVQQFEPTGEFVWMVGEKVDKTDESDLCAQAEAHTCGNGLQSSAEGGFASNPIIAVGPAGVLYAVDNVRLPGDILEQRLQRFESSGALIPPEKILLKGSLTFARALAVEADGEFWVTGQGTGLRKYDPDGDLVAGPFESGTNFARAGLAVGAGILYAGHSESRDKGGSFNVIAAYDPADPDPPRRRFAYTAAGGGSINGLAAQESAFGEVFFSLADFSEGGNAISYVFEPPPGPVVAPPSLEVQELGSAKTTLAAEVNPEGKASEVHFEYLTEEEFEEQGESFVGPATKSTAPKPLGATGFNLKAFEDLAGCPDPATEAELPESPCLSPETTYRWRVVATNADGEGNSPVEAPPFTTKESPELGEIYATRVGTDTARLNGEVNPNSIPATGFFEYVSDAAFQKDIGEGGDGFADAVKAPNVDKGQAPLDFGAGEAFATRSVAIFPLAPGTVYHYRLIADNPLVEPVQSEAEELRTFAPPDVAPCPNDASRIGAGAFLPDCRAYEMVSPLDKAGGDIRVLVTGLGRPAVLEQSAVSGERLAYGSVRSFGGAVSAPYTSQYIARRIAGKEWQTHPINPPRETPIIAVTAQAETEFKAFSADLCEAWLTTFAEPPLGPGALGGYSNLYRRTDDLCGATGKARFEALAPLVEPPNLAGPNFGLKLLGVSADSEHAAFLANDKITAEGSAGPRQLYESERGEGLRFVCVLPGGEPISGSCTAASPAVSGDPGIQIGRVSDDGERIFWSTPGTAEGKIYLRIGGTQTVAVSKEGEEESGTSASWFWGAAADGSVAIFSTHVGGGLSDLYEFDVDGEETELIAEGVVGVMGIGEDAARVYFASREAIAGENSEGQEAEEGEPNLYLREAEGGIEFIATLASGDLRQTVSKEAFFDRTPRVSPDGAHATFVSAAPLTGYDNKEAQSGEATAQIYRYDAAADELLCVSCNPSGARPAGPSQIPFWQSPMHAARVLSGDGSRLYFESADALAARDSNGQVDVYQWEEPGAGGCDEADGAFSSPAGGCVELVSSGQSSQGSRFVEASPSGSDVFIATGSSLLPQDFGVFDIYDARVGGGLPIPPPLPAPCEGDACAAQIAPPRRPTPASSIYTAPPDALAATRPARRRCAKGKRRVRRKGKVRCVAKHTRKSKRRHRRAR